MSMGSARTRLSAGAALLVGAMLVVYAVTGSDVPDDWPTAELQRGEFHITTVESGEIQATSGELVMSPRIGGRLKIIYLWPEGDQVDVGDLIIQFDPADFEREMVEAEGQLEHARAELEKAKAEHKQHLADLEVEIKQRQAGLKLAALNVQSQEYGSPIDLERSRIELAKSERSVEESRANLVAQEVVNRVELKKQQLSINRRQERYDRAKEHYEKTSLYAAKPGIVVYRKVWKRGTDEQAKVAVGDEVWGGRALMDIPDLSKMQVSCLVDEVDVKRLELGQPASVRLEAFPGPVFHGQVTKVAPIASPQPGAPDIRVFELLIDIEEKDERLKPGMSAQAEIVLETIPDALSVPLSAVFEVDGRELVYRRQGRGLKPTEPVLGARNFTAAVVDSGLQEGDVIALKDPTRN